MIRLKCSFFWFDGIVNSPNVDKRLGNSKVKYGFQVSLIITILTECLKWRPMAIVEKRVMSNVASARCQQHKNNSVPNDIEHYEVT